MRGSSIDSSQQGFERGGGPGGNITFNVGETTRIVGSSIDSGGGNIALLPILNSDGTAAASDPGGGNTGPKTGTGIEVIGSSIGSVFETESGDIELRTPGWIDVRDSNMAALSGANRDLFGGIGGSITLSAGAGIRITQTSQINSQGDNTGGNLEFNTPGPIDVRDSEITVFGGGVRSFDGLGGDVTFNVGGRILVINSHIDSRGGGSAGNIALDTHGLIDVRNSDIIVTSIDADGPDFSGSGGRIEMRARTIHITRDSLISTKSAGRGSITLDAPALVYVRDSEVTGEAVGVGGGGVFIFPTRAFVLENSTVNALSSGRPVDVRVRANLFLASDSRILTNAGTEFPETDVSESLAPLNASLFGNAVTLQESCAVLVGQGASTFVVSGRGGVPLEPGSWTPMLHFSMDEPSDGADAEEPESGR